MSDRSQDTALPEQPVAVTAFPDVVEVAGADRRARVDALNAEARSVRRFDYERKVLPRKGRPPEPAAVAGCWGSWGPAPIWCSSSCSPSR
jgi:hypothetical protein